MLGGKFNFSFWKLNKVEMPELGEAKSQTANSKWCVPCSRVTLKHNLFKFIIFSDIKLSYKVNQISYILQLYIYIWSTTLLEEALKFAQSLGSGSIRPSQQDREGIWRGNIKKMFGLHNRIVWKYDEKRWRECLTALFPHFPILMFFFPPEGSEHRFEDGSDAPPVSKVPLQ